MNASLIKKIDKKLISPAFPFDKSKTMETTNIDNISNLKLTIAELKIKLDTVCAQNERLSEENAKLKHENNRLKTDYNVSSNISIETRMRLHHLESEREDLNAALQEIKVKYSKLYDRYTTKARREKALEQFYNKQKSMPFAVPRNSVLDSLTKTNLTKGTITTTTTSTSNVYETIEDETTQVPLDFKQKLAEAHDIIAGLEFELESVNFLESENERMRKELEQLKLDRGQLQDVVSCNSVSSDESIYVNVNLPINETGDDDIRSVKATSRNLLKPPPDSLHEEDDAKEDDAPELRNVAYKRELLKNRLGTIYSKK